MSRPWHRLIGLGLCVLVLGGCGVQLPFIPHPTPEPFDGTIEITDPPPVLINGVEGDAVSWCWQTACADGALPDPEDAPSVGLPFVIDLPDEARGVEASAVDATGAFRVIAVDGDTIRELPEGTVMIFLLVYLQPNGDVGVAWAVEASGEPDP